MVSETSLGIEINLPNVTVLFGNSQSQLPALQNKYSNFDFVRLKQIHSDAVVETQDSCLDYQVLADAHWSTKDDLALCVITADCVPLFFYDPHQKIIAGIHAGWRGVASQIIPKTISTLLHKGTAAEALLVFVGPHIQLKSFEVEVEVRDQILTSLGPLSLDEKKEFYQSSPNAGKYLVDLNKVVLAQLSSVGISASNITNLKTDTVTTSDFHSYRRDKDKSGRQISFICRKKE